MNCPNCGGVIAPGQAKCLKCGSFVEPSPNLAGVVPQAPAPPPPQTFGNPAPPAAPTATAKSKLAAGLLGVFLGAFGIHRFYLGHTGVGLAQLLMTVVGSWFTCGVSAMAAGIWGLVEGILILSGSIDRDAQGRPLAP